MFTYSLTAVVIALVIAIVAQLFYSAGIISADRRNLCLATFVAWVGIAAAVFVYGVFAALALWFR